MRLIYAIFSSKYGLCFRAGANHGNVVISQSSIPMIQSIVMAALFCSICVVFCFCAYLKMVGIYAWRVVAFVHNYFAIRYLTYKKLISIAVRSNGFAASNHKNSIPISIFSSLPNPAFVSFLNFCFKSIFFRYPQMIVQSFRIPSLFVMFAAQVSSHRWQGANRTQNHRFYLMAHKSSCKNINYMPFQWRWLL